MIREVRHGDATRFMVDGPEMRADGTVVDWADASTKSGMAHIRDARDASRPLCQSDTWLLDSAFFADKKCRLCERIAMSRWGRGALEEYIEAQAGRGLVQPQASAKLPVPPRSEHWWSADPDERYWCEITDRDDVGADLKSPQTDETGGQHWSYSTMRFVQPGDIVFHYSAASRSIVGASVAGGPLESREIVWAPHGTVGRAKSGERAPRPGWWLPLYHFTRATKPLELKALDVDDERAWILSWIASNSARGATFAPFYGYGKGTSLRAAQAYLTKMPRAFVDRWPELTTLAAALEPIETELAAIAPALPVNGAAAAVRLKSDADYVAFVRGGAQRRTRTHERLVREAVEFFQPIAKVSTPHPVDLVMLSPTEILFEAKVVGNRSCVLAVREAVGQLHEYRHFLYPRMPHLCILLDREPDVAVCEYVENALGWLMMWIDAGIVRGGPRATAVMHELSAQASG